MFARRFATQNDGYSETLYNVNSIAVGGFAEPHRQFDGTSREYAPTVRIDNVEVHLLVGAILATVRGLQWNFGNRGHLFAAAARKVS